MTLILTSFHSKMKITLKEELTEVEYFKMLRLQVSPTVEELQITMDFKDWGFDVTEISTNPSNIDFPNLTVLKFTTLGLTSNFDMSVAIKPFTRNNNIQRLSVSNLTNGIIDNATTMRGLEIIKCLGVQQSTLDYLTRLKANPAIYTGFEIINTSLQNDTIDIESLIEITSNLTLKRMKLKRHADAGQKAPIDSKKSRDRDDDEMEM